MLRIKNKKSPGGIILPDLNTVDMVDSFLV